MPIWRGRMQNFLLSGNFRTNMEAMQESDPAWLRLPAELAMAAHQLREPLRMIRCYADLLADPAEDAALCATKIQESAIRLEARLTGMFEVLQLGEFVRLEKTDLARVVRHAVTRLAKPLRSSIFIHPLPSVQGDFEMLTEVFSRLIDNACKFKRAEPVRIDVTAEEEPASGKWRVSVADNGLGLEPARAERSFDMFERLNGRDFPGEGLGLTYCRRAIELHGGTIWIESTQGQGTAVCFTLPGG